MFVQFGGSFDISTNFIKYTLCSFGDNSLPVRRRKFTDYNPRNTEFSYSSLNYYLDIKKVPTTYITTYYYLFTNTSPFLGSDLT
jgi:hypothetical protein